MCFYIINDLLNYKGYFFWVNFHHSFHSVKLRKVRGGRTSPEGRAVLHLAADKSFACGQELRCAKEGLCMMEDAQSVTGFGGQLGNVAFPGKIMVDSETQKLE